MDLIGKTLSSRYEILEQIGEGGMAYVYKAKCKLLNRNVAVKVLKDEFSKDESFVKRFRVEAQAAASLIHPNIVSVFDVGEDNGINYIVMELLENRTLKDYIKEKGRLSAEEVLKISLQIASGLEVAHKAHIIHRDIKPQNIVLSSDLVAKVTDFGIAKATTTATITNFGTTMGSVHYFSPEQAKGSYVDEKSDIYSLGVVMYEMATGKVAFDGDSAVSIALKHIQEAPVPPIEINPAISSDLNSIILKAMAKTTINRYKSARELIDDINEVINNRELKTSRVTSIEAGATQVIPTLDGEEILEFDVPNVRMKNSNRRNVNNSRYVRNEENELDNINQNTVDNSEEKVKKVKKSNKIIIATIVILSICIIAVFSLFAIKIIRKLREERVEVETEYTIPNLVGRNYDEVVAEYAVQGIIIEQVGIDYHDTIAKGSVISQTPAKGEVTKDNKVSVVVSKGQNLVTMIDVVGKSITIAKHELETNLGFKLEIEEVIDDKIAENLIISQDKKKGEQLLYGSTIKLKVSKGDGKVKVLMPNVLNMTLDEARKALEDKKLKVNVKYDTDSSKKNNVVIKQSYPQNQELAEGDLVEITINKLEVKKTINFDIASLTDLTEYKEDDEIAVKVYAILDGSAENIIYDKKMKKDKTTFSITVNGYSTAILKVFIDEKNVKTETVKFN